MQAGKKYATRREGGTNLFGHQNYTSSCLRCVKEVSEEKNSFLNCLRLQHKDVMSSSAESEQERLSSVSSAHAQRRPVLARSTSYGAHDKMFATAAASAASGVTTAGLSAAPTPRHASRERARFSVCRDKSWEGQVRVFLSHKKK